MEELETVSDVKEEITRALAARDALEELSLKEYTEESVKVTYAAARDISEMLDRYAEMLGALKVRW